MPVLQAEDDVNPSVVDNEMDPALWGELHHFVNVEEEVAANLPLQVFYRALSVCKKWNALGWSNGRKHRSANPILFSTATRDAIKQC